jgi:hypothetical protein
MSAADISPQVNGCHGQHLEQTTVMHRGKQAVRARSVSQAEGRQVGQIRHCRPLQQHRITEPLNGRRVLD